MNFQKLIFAIIFLLTITTCKKEEGISTGEIKADIKTFYSLQNRIAKEFQATLSDTITDEYAHSERLLAWIKQQPDVQDAVMQFIYVFDVKHTNGLSGNIIFTPKETDGKLVTRGGFGNSDGKLSLLKSTDDDKIIENKNVLVLVQFGIEFYEPFSNGF